MCNVAHIGSFYASQYVWEHLTYQQHKNIYIRFITISFQSIIICSWNRRITWLKKKLYVTSKIMRTMLIVSHKVNRTGTPFRSSILYATTTLCRIKEVSGYGVLYVIVLATRIVRGLRRSLEHLTCITSWDAPTWFPHSVESYQGWRECLQEQKRKVK